MKIASFEYIYKVVLQTIISACNINYSFFSHKSSPNDIGVYILLNQSIQDIENLITYLSPDSKVVIGGLASRIV